MLAMIAGPHSPRRKPQLNALDQVFGTYRLRIRYERSSERFYALVLLACSVICFNALQQPPW